MAPACPPLNQPEDVRHHEPIDGVGVRSPQHTPAHTQPQSRGRPRMTTSKHSFAPAYFWASVRNARTKLGIFAPRRLGFGDCGKNDSTVSQHPPEQVRTSTEPPSHTSHLQEVDRKEHLRNHPRHDVRRRPATEDRSDMRMLSPKEITNNTWSFRDPVNQIHHPISCHDRVPTSSE